MSIQDLRQDWQRQIEAYDAAIVFLATERAEGVTNDGPSKPGRQWPDLLATWRDELKSLLAEYPA